jgi:hypothetical protein
MKAGWLYFVGSVSCGEEKTGEPLRSHTKCVPEMSGPRYEGLMYRIKNVPRMNAKDSLQNLHAVMHNYFK